MRTGFTGQDALEIKWAREDGQPAPVASQTERPAVTGFSWAKARDGRWLVRGPKGSAGPVKVVKRSGQATTETLGRVVQEFSDACLYEVIRR